MSDLRWGVHVRVNVPLSDIERETLARLLEAALPVAAAFAAGGQVRPLDHARAWESLLAWAESCCPDPEGLRAVVGRLRTTTQE